jgi:hypothetical protein
LLHRVEQLPSSCYGDSVDCVGVCPVMCVCARDGVCVSVVLPQSCACMGSQTPAGSCFPEQSVARQHVCTKAPAWASAWRVSWAVPGQVWRRLDAGAACLAGICAVCWPVGAGPGKLLTVLNDFGAGRQAILLEIGQSFMSTTSSVWCCKLCDS